MDLATRCHHFAARLPRNAVFSHLTAARLLGIPLPWRLERSGDIHISYPAPARAPHAAGLRGHRLTLKPGDVVSRGGLSLTSPVRTWLDLAGLLDVPELVAAGDHLVHWRLPLSSRDALQRGFDDFPGQRGIRRMRLALPLLSDRAESPPESILRVILVQGGLPEPTVNHQLVLTDDGGHLRPDFVFSDHRVILEYQGDYHRTKEQWRKDMTRRSRLEAAGWRVVELNWDDLQDPDELVSRVFALLSQSIHSAELPENASRWREYPALSGNSGRLREGGREGRGVSGG